MHSEEGGLQLRAGVTMPPPGLVYPTPWNLAWELETWPWNLDPVGTQPKEGGLELRAANSETTSKPCCTFPETLLHSP